MVQSVSGYNVLPLGSACNCDCRFCSHRQNPPGLKVIDIPFISQQVVEELLEFIHPGEKLIIGESATRINEGEPFLHPQLAPILERVRAQFPRTTIQITSNGTLLDNAWVKKLADLAPTALNLSLNSLALTPVQYQRLMRDLTDHGITCHASAVFEDNWSLADSGSLYRMIETAFEAGCASFRVFIPGYTRWTPDNGIKLTPQLEKRVIDYVTRTNQRFSFPVMVEPYPLTDLRCFIAGLIPGGAAQASGLLTGDEITAVDGVPAFSRANCYREIKERKNPELEIKRGVPGGFSRPQETAGKLTLYKAAGKSPGFAVYFDLNRATAATILETARRENAALTPNRSNAQASNRVFALASSLGYAPVQAGIHKQARKNGLAWPDNLTLVPVYNRFFGGNIKCGGLLTVADFRQALVRMDTKAPKEASTVLLPQKAFNREGVDLRGEHYLDLTRDFPDIQVELIH